MHKSSITDNWSDYLNDRLISKRNGYYVVKPKEEQNIVPFSCSICKFLYRTRNDESSHEEFGCCEQCAMRWAHPNCERWKAGYRPSQEEINQELETRINKMTVNIPDT